MAKGDFVYKSFVKDVEKELKKEQRKALRKAMKPLVNKIRENIGQELTPHTGNLRRGVVVDIRENIIFIGMDARKAPHAPLVELGSYIVGERFTTGEKSKPAGISSGVMPSIPFFLPAYRSVEDQLIGILREEWLP